jgi:hypothetical protein
VASSLPASNDEADFYEPSKHTAIQRQDNLPCSLLAQARHKIIPLRHGQDQSGQIQKHLFTKKSLNWGLKFEKVRESPIIMILVFFVNQFLSGNQPIFWTNSWSSHWSNFWTSLYN